eukprot:CAMPEP_0182912064 /NCGR_PEP_ID=MMETSP0034_2-20130328/37319_1 /TAXON_ID=156128 /ORGANISM="Nephroselmis pyriformis, Strain CCMP717" /LENGTH=221 /DNA_ID=CAMNT_0025048715 /DNA_START=45 /DNA_END=710 /DNA_ORIENTATION=-
MSDAGWDDDDFEPPSVVQEAPKTWEDEESSDDEKDLKKASAPKNTDKQAKKNRFKGLPQDGQPVDETLADPVAERLRQQKLVEDADYAATKELFGGGDGEEQMSLDDFVPKTSKDFECLGNMLAEKYLNPHYGSAHYTAMLKALLREALLPANAQEIKEVESTVIVMRNERTAAEKALSGKGKKAQKKAQLNSGAGKGNLTGGLDDYKYDDVGVDDDYDFM